MGKEPAICPLMSGHLWTSNGIAKLACERGECAWWEETVEECVVAVSIMRLDIIAGQLANLSEMLNKRI